MCDDDNDVGDDDINIEGIGMALAAQVRLDLGAKACRAIHVFMGQAIELGLSNRASRHQALRDGLNDD